MAFRLGGWLVEPSRNRISKPESPDGPGAEVRLEPKVMELLVLLVEHESAVVTKAQITERLWPGTHVTESSIFRHVSALRRALEDDRKRPRYIQTIPKKGYRIVMDVSRPVKPETLPRLALAASAVFVAAAIVALGVSSRSRNPTGHRVEPRAYETYLRGEVFENRRSTARSSSVRRRCGRTRS